MSFYFMTGCPFLRKCGKMCNKELNNNEVICSKHHPKNQAGGSIYHLNYPIGKTIGLATVTLMNLNQIAMNEFSAMNVFSNKKGGNKGKR